MAPQTNTPISKAHLATGRAVDQLRRQLGIVFQEDNGNMLGACPVEGLTPEQFNALNALPGVKLSLLLTGVRARHVGLEPGDAQTVSLPCSDLSLAMIQALADPLKDPDALPVLSVSPATPSQETLMTMAKYVGLLPALLLVEHCEFPGEWLQVSAQDVAQYWAAPPLEIVPLAEAALPIRGAEQAKIICFRQRYGTSMHLALLFGDIRKEPLTRIHSSCITGDILGSMRCDCGDQLQLAITRMAKEGNGILLYLHQEGRGIGIANKLRAYALQQRGIDTYDANLMLGFAEDERDFTIASVMLKTLNVSSIRLLTNNPRKIQNLGASGITIAERVPLIAEGGVHNHAYLEAKAKKSGHLF